MTNSATATQSPQAGAARRGADNRGRGIVLRIGGVTCFAAMMAAMKYGARHGVGPA